MPTGADYRAAQAHFLARARALSEPVVTTSELTSFIGPGAVHDRLATSIRTIGHRVATAVAGYHALAETASIRAGVCDEYRERVIAYWSKPPLERIVTRWPVPPAPWCEP